MIYADRGPVVQSSSMTKGTFDFTLSLKENKNQIKNTLMPHCLDNLQRILCNKYFLFLLCTKDTAVCHCLVNIYIFVCNYNLQKLYGILCVIVRVLFLFPTNVALQT